MTAPVAGSLSAERIRAGIVRRGRPMFRRGLRLVRRTGAAPNTPAQLRSRFADRARRNRDFVLAVTNRREAGADWQAFAGRLSDGWYGHSTAAWLVRTGVRSWRSLPGIETGAAVELGHQCLHAGDIHWAEVIADGVLAGSPTHRRGNQLKALVHAARGEWRPAQDRWRTALGGNRYRSAARRWAINERGRDGMRRLVQLMPAPESITAADGTSLRDVASLRADDPARVDRALGAVLINQAVHGNTTGLRPLLQAWAATQQRERIVLAPTEVAQSVRLMNLERFRSYLSGRSVALVANSPSLLGAGLGDEIDGHDVVLRFNSFALDPVHTGSRTSIHVAFHKYDFNLDVEVDVRILISAREDLWRESLKLRVRPHAQTWLGDASLRWPSVQLGLISADDPFKLPTAGFSMTRLLMHLGVCTAIDLYGFDFYESGMHRLAEAVKIPHSGGHNSAAEKAWVLDHALRVGDRVITMPTAMPAGLPVDAAGDLIGAEVFDAGPPFTAEPGADPITEEEPTR
jgi:hypothetical protein